MLTKRAGQPYSWYTLTIIKCKHLFIVYMCSFFFFKKKKRIAWSRVTHEESVLSLFSPFLIVRPHDGLLHR